MSPSSMLTRLFHRRARPEAPFVIAVDGPTASGKGTIAKRLAEHYGLRRLDTGALYRAVALSVLDAGGNPNDPSAAIAAAKQLDLAAIDENRIRTSEAGVAASKVAAMPAVREVLRKAQRAFAALPGGAVLDGRDIGTVICPNATVKLYVTAAPDVRARRRYDELRTRGEAISLDELTVQIKERDDRDISRPESPLELAADAHLLDTTHLSADEAVAAAVAIVDRARA